ncbi:MAG: biotin transporter BioY [Lachnospiraceae bacterium]|nr:biotin transporter BioY [Lachnospiraceae bacterium]
MNNTKKSKFSVKDLVLIGMFAAFLAVISQLAIPMPTGVPITIQVFGIALVGAILGAKRGTIAVIIYILIGAVGAPVFANFQGGLQVITSTAGGYIIGWPFMAALSGIRPDLQNKKVSLVLNIVFALIGLAIVEGVGALQWAFLTQGDLKPIIIYSFTAFIPKDIMITVLAIMIGRPLRKYISKESL